MKLLSEWFERLFGDKTFTFTQEQRQGIIDLLVIMMYADGYADEDEFVALKTSAARLGWEGPIPLARYIDQSAERFEGISGMPEKIPALIDLEVQRIHSRFLVQKVYEHCRSLALADAHFDPREQDILNCLKKHIEA